MATYRTKAKKKPPSDEKLSYFNYKLDVSRKYVHLMILVAGVFNLTLLFPDMLLADGSKKNAIIIIRVIYTVALLGVYVLTKRTKKFETFFKVVTACELAAFAIFFFVLSQYSHPDFLIQTMGLVVIIIVVFFIPNHLADMVAVAILGFYYR